MNNEIPTRTTREVLAEEEAARQHIAAEQAEQNARFLASENAVLRNRVVEDSNSIMPMLGLLAVVAAIVAAFLFLGNSNKEVRQQAEAARMDAAQTRQEASAANYRAKVAQDAAYRAGLRSQAADATAQQATNAAIRAQQEAAQKPAVIVAPPQPPAVIVTPPETTTSIPSNATPAPVPPVTEDTENPSSEQKPLEGRIE